MFDPAPWWETPPSASWFTVGAIHPDTFGRPRCGGAVPRRDGRGVGRHPLSKWMKLVANAAELVPSAILIPLAEAVEVPGCESSWIGTGRRRSDGHRPGNRPVPIFAHRVSLPPAVRRPALDIVLYVLHSPPQTTVLQDWLKGRRSEVHEINGLVAREVSGWASMAPPTPARWRWRWIEAGRSRLAPTISLLLAEDLAHLGPLAALRRVRTSFASASMRGRCLRRADPVSGRGASGSFWRLAVGEWTRST